MRLNAQEFRKRQSEQRRNRPTRRCTLFGSRGGFLNGERRRWGGRQQMKIIATFLFACFIAQSSSGQTPIIVQNQDNGTLTWTNDVTNVQYRVEWASSLDGPWYYSWESLSHVNSGTNYSLTVPIPMFYRVVTLPESEHLTIQADPDTVLTGDGDKTVLTVSGGTPPYTWSVGDISLGNIITPGGYSVVYERSYHIDNTVRVADALGDYAIIAIQQP